MFTQCSKCETVFRLSAETLRAAGGQVRCGRCGEVFSALARLAEDAGAFTKGESPLDLETRADEILQTTPPLTEFDLSDVFDAAAEQPREELARLEFLNPPDDEFTAETSLEFTLPPGELDRIFIETPPSALQRLAAEGHGSERHAAEPVDTNSSRDRAAQPPALRMVHTDTPSTDGAVENDGLAQADLVHDDSLHPSLLHDELAQDGSARLPATNVRGAPPQSRQLQVDPTHGALPRGTPAQDLPTADAPIHELSISDLFTHDMARPSTPVSADAVGASPRRDRPLRSRRAQDDSSYDRSTQEVSARNEAAHGAAAHAAPAARISGLVIAEDVRRDMLSSYMHAELPQINVPRRRLPFAAWLSATVLLMLLLAAQLVYDNSEWLTAHASLLGGASTAAPNPSSYQLRQWGVTGDPAAKGTLRVRASIMNVAAQLQPYPLLRVALVDRFGKRVGTREFEPAEYLGHATARMLTPGERTDATLDILDPGKNAEGFEIDVCVRNANKKIACAGDAATPVK